MHEMIHPLGTLLEDTFKIFRERWKSFLVIGVMSGVTSMSLNGAVALLDAASEEDTQADWTEYEEWDDDYQETYDEYYDEYYDEVYDETFKEELLRDGWTEEEIEALLAEYAEEESTNEEGNGEVWTEEEKAMYESQYDELFPLPDDVADSLEAETYDDEWSDEEYMPTEEEVTDWSDPAVIVGMGLFVFGGICFFLLIMWLSVWLQTAAMLLSFPKKIPLGKALRESARASFPVLGVVFFLFVYSGVWLLLPAIFLPFPISLVAVIAVFVWAVAVGPRLSIAPVVYLEQRKGIHAAVKKAFEVTRGRWLKIVGNMIAITFVMGAIATMLLLAGLIVVVPLIFLAFLSPVLIVAPVIVGIVILIAATALMPMLQQIFLVQLSLTLLKNPKHK